MTCPTHRHGQPLDTIEEAKMELISECKEMVPISHSNKGLWHLPIANWYSSITKENILFTNLNLSKTMILALQSGSTLLFLNNLENPAGLPLWGYISNGEKLKNK